MAFLNETGLEQVWGKIKTKVNSIENTISDINKAKVDKISGKGLSTNDYTTDEKNKWTVHKRMILLFLSCLLFISADVKISINKNSYMEE